MQHLHTLTNYDVIALVYDRFRLPNLIIAEYLSKAFCKTEGPVLSIGCGTGQYEAILSEKIEIIGLDKSQEMVSKAKERILNVTRGDMTGLPYVNSSFSGAYFMQSLHHVGANLSISTQERSSARQRALKEAIRVVHKGPIFIVQRDPSQNQAVWFWKFFPRALEIKLMIQPKVEILAEWLDDFGLENVTAKPIHDTMIRGFYDPEAPLDPGFRRSFSEFSYLSEQDVREGVEKLKLAIHDGSVIEDIRKCKLRFSEIGGSVFIISGKKR